MEYLSFRIFLNFLKIEEASLDVRAIQNRVSIICDAMKEIGFLFAMLLNI